MRRFGLFFTFALASVGSLTACTESLGDAEQQAQELSPKLLSSRDFLNGERTAYGAVDQAVGYDRYAVEYVKSLGFSAKAGDRPRATVRAVTSANVPVAYLVAVDVDSTGARSYRVIETSVPSGDPRVASVGNSFVVPQAGEYFIAVRDAYKVDGRFLVTLTNGTPPPAPPPPPPGLVGCTGTPVSLDTVALMIPQGEVYSRFSDNRLTWFSRQCNALTGCTDWRTESYGTFDIDVVNSGLRVELYASSYPLAFGPLAANPSQFGTMNLGAGYGDTEARRNVGVTFKATSNCVSLSTDAVQGNPDETGTWQERKLATALSWTPTPRFETDDMPPFADNCSGVPASDAELIAKFSPGRSSVRFGSGTSFSASRRCTMTGCSAWNTWSSDMRNLSELRTDRGPGLALYLRDGNGRDGLLGVANGAVTGTDLWLGVGASGVVTQTCAGYTSDRKVESGGYQRVARFVGRF